MFMDYTKLWKILVEKDMTKAELMEITGLSSRIIAKLTKNETVTTDTLAKICSALGCDVGDIMELNSENNLSLYNTYKKLGKVISETEAYKEIYFTYKGKSYRIYAIKRVPSRSTIIHCREDKTIYWEQLYPFGGTMRPSSEISSLIKPIPKKDEVTIVLFKGRPSFMGLDYGTFASSKYNLATADSVYVMSEAALKVFEADKKN